MTNKTNRWKCYSIVFFLALGFRVLLYLRPIAYMFRSDDFGPLIYPAALAGYDWKGFVSGMTKYYGFGYYWLFTPLFWLKLSTETMVMVISVVNTVLVALSAVLIDYLLREYFQVCGLPGVFLSVMATFFIGDVEISTELLVYRSDNEIPLYLACWLIVWLVLHILRAKQKVKRSWVLSSAGMGLLLSWSLSVHERAFSLVIAVVFVELLLLVLTRKTLFHPLSFFVSLAGFTALQYVLRSALIQHFFGHQGVSNTSAFSRMSAWFLQGTEAMKALLVVLLGNLHGVWITAFGLSGVGLVVVVYYLVQRRSFWGGCSDHRELTVEEDGEGVLLLLFLSAVLVVIDGLAVKWGHNFYQNLQDAVVGNGYKGITYVRYYYAFLGPLSVLSLVFLHRHKAQAWGIAGAAFLLTLSLELLFMKLVYPYCAQKGELNYIKRANPLKLLTGLTQRQNLFFNMLLMLGILFCLFAGAVLYRTFYSGNTVPKASCLKKGVNWICRGSWITLAPFLILLLILAHRCERMDMSHTSFSMAYGTEVTALLGELEEDNLLPETIYVQPDSLFRMKYYLQTAYPAQSYVIGLPEDSELSEPTLVILENESDDLKQAGYQEILLEEVYLYTNSEEIYQYASACQP